jgi:hypothetical protein
MSHYNESDIFEENDVYIKGSVTKQSIYNVFEEFDKLSSEIDNNNDSNTLKEITEELE